MDIHAVSYTFYKDGVKLKIAYKLLETEQKVQDNSYAMWSITASRKDCRVNSRCYVLQGQHPCSSEAKLFVENNNALFNT
jgi:hypothetical protein